MKRSEFYKKNKELCQFINKNWMIKVYHLNLKRTDLKGAGKLNDFIESNVVLDIYRKIKEIDPLNYTWSNRKDLTVRFMYRY